MICISTLIHLFAGHLGKLSIPLNLHSRRVRRDRTIISVHIHSQASNGRQLLQLTLWSRRTTEILQLSNNPQHSRQCDLAHAEAEALVWTKAKVGVLTQVTIQTDLVRIRPCLGIVACRDLDNERNALEVKLFLIVTVK